MAVSWAKGSRFKTDASIAKEVMDKLAEEGRLNAAELVEVSRPEDAPLHGEFEWNDSVAAQKWREQTGRVMIATIVVTKDEEPEPEPIRAYFNIEHTSHEYIPTEIIMSDQAKRERLLEIAKRELDTFRKKYGTLKELAKVFRAIDELNGE